VDLGSPPPRLLDDPRPAAAWARLRDAARAFDPIAGDRSEAGGGAGSPPIALHVDASVAPSAGGYHLSMTPQRVIVTGADAAGCSYGLHTLLQLLRLGRGRVPVGEVCDWPDLATRGMLLDVSRGRVPTLETLQERIDRLAQLKINQVQLYVEHTFAFGFDGDISAGGDALTPDEVCELDAFCHERFIDLVPALASPGHMGRILSMPRYRRLAEIEPPRPWSEMTWLQRLRGATIDVLSPRAMRLVTRMWDELLDAFSSPVVNVCGDEPHDLGRGRNRDRMDKSSAAAAYRDWIRGVAQHVQRRGRQVQAWSDVIVRHPEIWSALPDGMTVLHWGYNDQADYAATQRFIENGAATVVCPGVMGWKRILNALDAAERNIATFARQAGGCGAAGMLNTDWGDFGHFNGPACSWHGLALGAALAWRTDHETGEPFDRRLAWWMFGCDDAKVFTQLRRASQVGEKCETWRSLASLGTAEAYPGVPLPAEVLGETIAGAEAAESALQSEPGGSCQTADRSARADSEASVEIPFGAQLDVEELLLACSFTRCWAERMLMDGRAASRGSSPPATWIDALADLRERYRLVWLARYKPLGLADIETCFDVIVDPARPCPRMSV